MKNLTSRFASDECGATAIEYGAIVGMVALAILGAVALIGENLAAVFIAIAAAFEQ